MNSNVSTPEPFPFDLPEQWPEMCRASEKSSEDTLIYSMGDKAEDILDTFKLSLGDSENFNIVKQKYDQHFMASTNVTYERAMFNKCCQQEGESIDAFVTDLHVLAKTCDFKGLEDDFIRDRIVVGYRDVNLYEMLIMTPDLILEDEVKGCTRTKL